MMISVLATPALVWPAAIWAAVILVWSSAKDFRGSAAASNKAAAARAINGAFMTVSG